MSYVSYEAMRAAMRTRKAMRAYPYIWAWGKELRSFAGYMEAESAKAETDGAPSDVIYGRDVRHVSEQDVRQALAEEQAGTAYVVRDSDGKPVRVWWRAGSIVSLSAKARVAEYAAEYADIRPTP